MLESGDGPGCISLQPEHEPEPIMRLGQTRRALEGPAVGVPRLIRIHGLEVEPQRVPVLRVELLLGAARGLRRPSRHRGGARRELRHVKIELQLPGGVVADTNRTRAAIPLQVQATLGGMRASVQPIEHRQAWRSQPSGVEEPPKKRHCLLVASELEQGFEGERGVTDPAIAIIPVTAPSNHFGE